MLFYKKERKKDKITTLKDCKEYFKNNPEYRYVVVCGMDRKPLSMCQDLESAKDSCSVHMMSRGELPVEIVDLIYLEERENE